MNPTKDFLYLYSAVRALYAAFSDMPAGPDYAVEATLFVNVRYPGNTESVTLDHKRRDVEDFTRRLNDMAAAMNVAARAAADAGGEVTDDGILTISP